MSLTINNTEITTDDLGRYSLNDLHKSSGGEKRHSPNYYYASKNFKETIAILNTEKSVVSPIIKKQGRYSGGTWVCRDLVIDYAMWVSPKFKMSVIRLFLAIADGDHDKAQAIISNDKEQLDLIEKRDRVMASKIPPGKKADRLVELERKWLDIGSTASKSLSMRRGQSFKFIEAQESLLNEIQTKFEF